MGGPIIISYDELNDAYKQLEYVKGEMDNITSRVNDICAHIGSPEPDFSGELHDFDSSWDDNRKNIVDAVGKMAEVTKKFLDDWTKFDNQAGDALHQGFDSNGTVADGVDGEKVKSGAEKIIKNVVGGRRESLKPAPEANAD